jgi:hypothetical protein
MRFGALLVARGRARIRPAGGGRGGWGEANGRSSAREPLGVALDRERPSPLGAVRVALLAGAALLVHCAPAISPPPRHAIVEGVWDAQQRATDLEGDERISQHEWQIEQRGRAVRGFWTRGLTWVAHDGRAFACCGRPRCSELVRQLFSGEARREGVRVRLASATHDPGRCPAEERAPAECVLRRRDARLEVRCESSGALSLARRLDAPVPSEVVTRDPGTVTGIWTWHQRSVDPDGDMKVEEEVWQLRQVGRAVDGFYDRTVWVRSGDGRRFQCNNHLQYTSHARFRVRGEVHGQRLRIRELGYKTEPSTCETGHRSLDAYEGWIQPDGKTIELSWGSGAQRLYRRY